MLNKNLQKGGILNYFRFGMNSKFNQLKMILKNTNSNKSLIEFNKIYNKDPEFFQKKTDNNGNTLLMLALKYNNYPIVKLLLENIKKELLNKQYQEDKTVLIYLIFYYKTDISELLIIARLLIEKMDQEGLNIQDNKGKTALKGPFIAYICL